VFRHLHLSIVLALATASSSVDALAQATPPAAPAASPTRAVLGTPISLPTVTDGPRVFVVHRVTLTPGQPTQLRGDGFLYVLSGNVAATVDGQAVNLGPNQAVAVTASAAAQASASSTPNAVALYFGLGKPADPVMAPPNATTTLIYKGEAPLPGLQPGKYEFSLARVVFPAGSPTNAPHRRSGAAVYYVESGTGLFTANGKAETRTAGAVQYEPNDLMHQWGNPGNSPLVFVQANISAEGAVPVIFP
jgi:quercetin dioxygenase-like cupin family protein